MYYDAQFTNDLKWMNTIGRNIYDDIQRHINHFNNLENDEMNKHIRSLYAPYILRHLFSVWKGLFNSYHIYNTYETQKDISKLYIEAYNHFYEIYNENIDIMNIQDLKHFLDKTTKLIYDEFII